MLLFLLFCGLADDKPGKSIVYETSARIWSTRQTTVLSSSTSLLTISLSPSYDQEKINDQWYIPGDSVVTTTPRVRILDRKENEKDKKRTGVTQLLVEVEGKPESIEFTVNVRDQNNVAVPYNADDLKVSVPMPGYSKDKTHLAVVKKEAKTNNAGAEILSDPHSFFPAGPRSLGYFTLGDDSGSKSAPKKAWHEFQFIAPASLRAQICGRNTDRFKLKVDGKIKTQKHVRVIASCELVHPGSPARADQILHVATIRFTKQYFEQKSGPMRFELHDPEGTFEDAGLIGEGDYPLPVYASILLVVGTCMLFLGIIAGVLFYIGDIGSRPVRFNDTEEYELGYWRRIFWPVYGFELAKVLPLMYLFFLGIFVNATFKNIKEGMLTNDTVEMLGVGLVITNWTKLFLVLGFSFGSSVLMLYLLKKYRLPNIAMGVAATFLIYFMFNAYLIYPFRKSLYINGLIEWLKTQKNQYASGFFGLFAFWPMTFHYVVSELWSALGMGFIIWGYVNSINGKSAAHRYYSLLPALGQLGQILAAVIMDKVSSGSKEGFWSFEYTVYWLNAGIAVILVLFILNLWFLDRIVMSMPKYQRQARPESTKKTEKKEKPSLCSSLAFCFKNYHVLAILLIIFSQGAFEVMEQLTYKDATNIAYNGDASAYTSWKSFEQMLTACAALVCILFVGSNVLRLCGYRVTALITPAFVVVMGTVFYMMAITLNTYNYGVYFKNLGETKYGMSDSGNGSIWVVAWLGLALNVGMQGFKYSVFDSTKEIAYLNLTKEERIRAKAVGDILGQRGGKSFAALVNCFLLPAFGGASVAAIQHEFNILTFCIMCLEVTLWIGSVFYLARYISNQEREKKMQEIAEDKEAAITIDAKEIALDEKTPQGTKTSIGGGTQAFEVESKN